jgi:hypothetical protein
MPTVNILLMKVKRVQCKEEARGGWRKEKKWTVG